MRRFTALALALSVAAFTSLSVSAQTAPPPSLSVADQLSLNGSVIINSVSAPQAGWVVVQTYDNNASGPVIGIASVPQGESQAVQVPVDVLAASTNLVVTLHVDDNTIGTFENADNSAADAPMTYNNIAISAPFHLTAIRAYDQMVNNNSVVVAGAVVNTSAWVVIYADQNGQPGAVLGETALHPGTNPNVAVALQSAPPSKTVWATLHTDDSQIGTFEFNSGADQPINVNGVQASTPFNLTDTMPVITADGQPIAISNNQLPSLAVSNAVADVVEPTGNLLIDSLFTVGPGWIDIHADDNSHPGKSVGMAPVPGGQVNSLTVALNAAANTITPTILSPIVWPMLHADTGQPGVWEFMRVPGADLPIIVNGAVLTFPVHLFNPPAATAEATATAEVTASPTPTATATESDNNNDDDHNATETPEATSVSTENPGGPSGTEEPTAESTNTNSGPTPTAEVTAQPPTGGTPEATP